MVLMDHLETQMVAMSYWRIEGCVIHNRRSPEKEIEIEMEDPRIFFVAKLNIWHSA